MRPTNPEPAPTASVAFKEWLGVCDALASGRQSILLRKGGIAEGPGGFRPEHPAFWLYPTRLHEAEQGLRERVAPVLDPGTADVVNLQVLAVVADVAFVERADLLPALADLHVWDEATIGKRFEYRRPGLWVLAVRAYLRPEPWPVAVTPEHAGCKSWVPLADAPPSSPATAVIDDAAFGRVRERLAHLAGAYP